MGYRNEIWLFMKSISNMRNTRKILFIIFFTALFIKFCDSVIIDNFFPQCDKDYSQDFVDIFKDVLLTKFFDQNQITFHVIAIDTTTADLIQKQFYTDTYLSHINHPPQKNRIHIINSVLIV